MLYISINISQLNQNSYHFSSNPSYIKAPFLIRYDLEKYLVKRDVHPESISQ
jgi:hypothetical protein